MTQMGINLLQDIWPAIAAEGALTTVTYQRITQGSVTSTSLVSGNLGITTYSTSWDVIRSDYKTHEIDGVRVMQGDVQIRGLKNALSVTPQAEDIVMIDSARYRVVRPGSKTDGATWILQLRSPA